MSNKQYLSLYPPGLTIEDEPLEYLIEGILPRIGFGILLGPTGTGKTQLAMRTAACIIAQSSMGEGKAKFGDLPLDFAYPAANGLVVYLAAEGKSMIKNRIRSALSSLPEYEQSLVRRKYGENPPIIPIKVDTALIDSEQIPLLEQLINEAKVWIPGDLKPVLIILDTLGAGLNINDENNNSEMQRIGRALNAYAEYFNCFVLALAHPPKSKEGKKGYVRGASSITGNADVVLTLEKINASGHRKVSITKTRDSAYEGVTMAYKIESVGSSPAFIPVYSNTTVTKAEDAPTIILNDKHEKILEFLRKTSTGHAPQSIITNAIATKLMSDPSKSTPTNRKSVIRGLRRNIEDLEALHLVSREGKGKTTIIRLQKCHVASVPDQSPKVTIGQAKELFRDVKAIPPPITQKSE